MLTRWGQMLAFLRGAAGAVQHGVGPKRRHCAPNEGRDRMAEAWEAVHGPVEPARRQLSTWAAKLCAAMAVAPGPASGTVGHDDAAG